MEMCFMLIRSAAQINRGSFYHYNQFGTCDIPFRVWGAHLQVIVITIHYFLFAIYHPPFVIYYNAVHYSAIHYSLFAIHYPVHYSLFTFHYFVISLFTIHYSIFTIHYSLFVIFCVRKLNFFSVSIRSTEVFDFCTSKILGIAARYRQSFFSL